MAGSAVIGALRATLGLDSAAFDKGIDTSRKKLKAAEAQFGRIGDGFQAKIAGILGGVSVAAIASQFLDIADTAKSMDAQLRLATRGFGSFGQAQADVSRIAEATRSDLEATTKLYGGFARAAKETGRSQDDAARATETFSKALKLGGAGAAETASATLQFNQALQSGVLRGDEFNSIMEASPRLARLLADALGVPIGQLRAMAENGQITSDVLYRALTDRKFTAGIDEEFQTLPKTFGEAMTLVRNAAIETFGAFDRGGEFSTSIANFVTDGSAGFSDLADRAEDFGRDLRATIAGLTDAFAPLYDAGERFFTWLNGQNNGAGTIDVRGSLGEIDTLTGWLSQQGMLGAALTGNDPFSSGPRAGTNFQGRYDAGNAASRQSSLRRSNDRFLAGMPMLPANDISTPKAPPAPAAQRSVPKNALKTATYDAQALRMAAYDAAVPLDLVTTSLVDLTKIDVSPLTTQIPEIGTGARYSEEEVQDLARSINTALAGSLIDLATGAFSLEKTFLRVLDNIGTSIISNLLEPLGGGTGGGIGGAIATGIGSLFGKGTPALDGARATGGPVLAGRNYLVGERGPEVFSPGSNGTIIANDAIGGRRGMTFNQYVTLPLKGNAIDQAEFAQGLMLMGAETRRAIAEAERRRT